MDGRVRSTTPFPSRSRFPFFPRRRGIRQRRHAAAMGQFARTKFNFLRPIDFFFLFFLFIFSSPSSPPFSLPSFFSFCYGIAREREVARGKKKELNRRKGGRGKKVGRDGIFYGECVHGWRGESNRELHAATRMLVSRGIPLVHLRSFAKPILTRLRFDVHARA